MRLPRRALRGLLRRAGYELRPLRAAREPIAERAGEDAPYYREYATPWAVFAPWTEPAFQQAYDGIGRLTAGTPERGYMIASLARYAKALPRGDFAECGVYRGGSALLLCRILREEKRTLLLFDSFQGLPKPNPTHDPVFAEGQYAAAVREVKQQLSEYEYLTDFRAGWIPDTFAGLQDRQFAFVHVDLDLYQPTLDCCAFFYPRLIPGGVLLFDEYGWASAHGEKAAVDKFFVDKPEHPIVLITGQAFVIKLPAGAANGRAQP